MLYQLSYTHHGAVEIIAALRTVALEGDSAIVLLPVSPGQALP